MKTSYSNFLATHPPIFSGQRTRWMQMIGSTPPNQSLAYYTAQSTRRLCMSHNIREVQQGPSGHRLPLRCQQTTTWHGMSSTSHSMVTTCQRARCDRDTILCMTTLRSLTTWHSTVGTMLTLMLRRLSSITRDSISYCRTA
jgi:hypothetical protein